MNHDVKTLAERFLHRSYDELVAHEKLVLERMAKRRAVTQNVNERFHDELTVGQRLAGRVAAFGGSWSFIVIFAAVLAVWVLINAWMLPQADVFDPYPFVFLNLILSMLAAIQAPVIMMSQNRQTSKDRLAAANDYEVNLKAELEIMDLHEKIDDVRTRQLETLLKQQGEQIAQLKMLMERIGK